jgi:hypothetical protein
MATKLVRSSAAAMVLACCLGGAPAAARAEARFIGVLHYEGDVVHPIQERRRIEAMSGDDLVAALAARGYRDISTPRRKGGYYVVEAMGRRGERLTLIVDIFNGEISGLRRRFD